jgi:hypothetical protein
VSFLGYEPYVLSNINLSSGKELILNIALRASFTELAEVEVKAKKNSAEANNEIAVVSARSFSVQETQRYAAATGIVILLGANSNGICGAASFLTLSINSNNVSPPAIIHH